MTALVGNAAQLGWVALKVLLLFAVAVAGLRLTDRRTLAQLGVYDFVVTVATGAIIGRTATASTTSFITGAVALITLLAAHRVLTELNRRGRLGHLLDRRPLVIVNRGRLNNQALAAAGLSRRDALRILRQAGLGGPEQASYVLYEQHGGITILPADQEPGTAQQAGLEEAVKITSDTPPERTR